MTQSEKPRIDFIGRLVGGSLFEGSSVDDKGQPKVYKTGARAGQPRTDFSFGVAIEKTSPYWPTIWGHMNTVAKAGFPNLFGADGNCNRPDFSWKYIDGDSAVPNKNNKIPAQQEGYPGNYIMWFSGTTSPKVYTKDAVPLSDPNQILCGYYIRVIGSMSANMSTQSPGIYLNYEVVQEWQPGPVIEKGPDLQGALSKGPEYVPTNMLAGTPSATPAPTPAPEASAPPVAPAPEASAPPVAPVAPPTAPAMDYGVQLTEKARNAGYTYDSLKGAGWTDQQMRDGGYIA